MKIIEGFTPAKAALTRKPLAELYAVSPAIKGKLQEMFATGDPAEVVRQIVNRVRREGDAALIDYTRQIDGIELASPELDKEKIKSAYREVDDALVAALRLAAGRIRAFHSAQKENIGREFTIQGLSQLVRPLERVGVYAPGGTAPYPSTVLMTAVPAKVAGVQEVVLVTPPNADGAVPPLVAVAADIAGVDRVFPVGGAQAIAALAFGTESVPKVDKICGPGNVFVVLAKKLVFGAVAIDGLQGPSEVLIIADEMADPGYCAADLLAQAEHDPLASSILVTTSRRLAEAVNREVERQMEGLSRRGIAAESLKNQGLIAVVADINEALELANTYAPEHLSLMVDGADTYLDRITNAGCVFTGNRATVMLGDYIAGPSHALPTGGTARFSSPLSVADFIKFINVVGIDEAGLQKLGPVAAAIARAEGFTAHARAVEKRLEKG